jgi:single-strand DNA-binding protein
MINKVILLGNVGADPEVRHINEELQVARFTLATSDSYKKDGERITQTEWHNIVAWRGLSKVVEQYVKKGTQLYIEGKITTRSYEKDGQTKYFTEIVANELKMIGRKSDSQEGYQTPQENKISQPATVAENDIDLTPDDGDDLPF